MSNVNIYFIARVNHLNSYYLSITVVGVAFIYSFDCLSDEIMICEGVVIFQHKTLANSGMHCCNTLVIKLNVRSKLCLSAV